MAEELWTKLGHVGSIAYAKWPEYDESKLVKDEVEVVVQVNGRVRQHLKVSSSITKEELEKAAMADEHVKEFVEGKNVVRVIAVPGKLVNIVVK